MPYVRCNGSKALICVFFGVVRPLLAVAWCNGTTLLVGCCVTSGSFIFFGGLFLLRLVRVWGSFRVILLFVPFFGWLGWFTS